MSAHENCVVIRQLPTERYISGVVDRGKNIVNERSAKGVGNYRLIVCLKLLWNVLTGTLTKKIYSSLRKIIFCHYNNRDSEKDPRTLRTNF